MPLAKKIEKRYTYADYVTWPDDERWEIIDGIAYNISPAPRIKHQDITGKFFSRLEQKLTGKPSCRPFIAPTDVVFSENDIVQPDILVVCEKNKITEANIQGAPDLIVEVISPSTAIKDKREKMNLYEKHKVREYIIIYPMEEYTESFILGEDGAYNKGKVFGPKEVLSLESLQGIEIPLCDVFGVEE